MYTLCVPVVSAAKKGTRDQTSGQEEECEREKPKGGEKEERHEREGERKEVRQETQEEKEGTISGATCQVSSVACQVSLTLCVQSSFVLGPSLQLHSVSHQSQKALENVT